MSAWSVVGAGVALSALAYCLGQSRRAAANAAHAQQLERALERSSENVAALMELAVALYGAWDVATLKQAITARLPLLLGTDEFWVTARLKEWTVLTGEPAEAGSPLPDRLTPRPDAWESFPLSSHGKALGLLCVRQPDGEMTQEQRRTITTAAALMGAAIRHVRRYTRMRSLSTIDSLTWCFTRRYGTDALSREMHRMRRSPRSLCVAMLDLDNFKAVNDTHGHAVGDRVLATVGRVMRKALRASDIACRYGGEEFLLILPDTTLGGGVRAVENLRRRISTTPVDTGGPESIFVRASVGVTQVHPTDEDPTAPIRRADLLMYEAKRAGRDQVIAQDGSLSTNEPAPS